MTKEKLEETTKILKYFIWFFANMGETMCDVLEVWDKDEFQNDMKTQQVLETGISIVDKVDAIIREETKSYGTAEESCDGE